MVDSRSAACRYQNSTEARVNHMAWLLFIFGGGLIAAVTAKSRNIAIQKALATIRKVESGGNYGAENPTSSASGAYQFLDTTWGNFAGYARAKDAPPEIQDKKAALMVKAIQQKFGQDPKWIPAAWYAGMNGAASIDWGKVLPGNKSTIAQYVNRWLDTYQGMT